MVSSKGNLTPIVSKIFCSASQIVLTVRRRPHVVNGGGFVVTDCSQRVVFRVDGCGTLGVRGELMLRDADGEPLLLIRRKGGIVQALSVHRQWRGYMLDYEGMEKLIFCLKEPKSFLVKNNSIKVCMEPRRCSKNWDFQIKGSFPARACTIFDSKGNIVAQVEIKKEVEELLVSKDLYHVVVQPGFDKAFVFGIIAILDNIYDESTQC
ncbi:PREDICTED: protein LURP-one-related 6 [Nelumbo nucifera]|uniref:Protein LURP-one-related 6 n=2 Tax=Nelumbo nucifera TaxID=4432 RepID=A0A822ZGG9_NELNU|nr:PREDICTED: protein LURP-one-related 6 [Nelumbo nucifera]DAD44232.1 TPA_asm: hypothetical protein HUJ06_002462 [Nelumbo nucifera]